MGIKNRRKGLIVLNKLRSRKKTSYSPYYCSNEKACHQYILGDSGKKVQINPTGIVSRRLINTSVDRKEESKAMIAYKKNVTKSPETANAFLKRIGAFDIK